MPRTLLTDEERAERREARLRRARAQRAEKAAEREKLKSAIRDEIVALASVIPLHVREGGVHTVRTWKGALDSAMHAAETNAASVERLQSARDALKIAARA
ncbi:hypothetical protein KTE57_17340 [Burkholderia multivorans]|uniref:hypothetical protein n=1 Tax=Burkholderia multivorans TaxID=87883 RepID=UPI001C2250CE|nr:hypothetical protein [Burkholderia multivorans]MBU9461336.1 hypothetical protein [Burkholderia multivorans]